MERFVCVRIVRANLMDLALFDFDPNLTFAVFFLNPDRTIYGRYGSRSDFLEAEREMSLVGLRKAMLAALDLHTAYPANRTALQAKQPPPPRHRWLTDDPWIRTRPHANNPDACMHCHHIGNAEQAYYRAARKPIPDRVLFHWPMPDVVGLKLDPREKATVQSVVRASAAARAGFAAGDRILTLDGQPIISIADVQWVLQQKGEPAQVRAEVARGDRRQVLTLELQPGWRRHMDISWRPTTFLLRRMVLGGLRVDDLSAADRRRLGLGSDQLALRVRSVFRNQPAARAGFRRADVIVDYAGHRRRMSETELLRLGVQQILPGTRVPVTVMRGDRRVQLRLTTE